MKSADYVDIKHAQKRQPPKYDFWIYESSIRRILSDASNIWKESRRKIAAIFTPQTTIESATMNMRSGDRVSLPENRTTQSVIYFLMTNKH